VLIIPYLAHLYYKFLPQNYSNKSPQNATPTMLYVRYATQLANYLTDSGSKLFESRVPLPWL
jgi:hypothetical protein